MLDDRKENNTPNVKAMLQMSIIVQTECVPDKTISKIGTPKTPKTPKTNNMNSTCNTPHSQYETPASAFANSLSMSTKTPSHQNSGYYSFIEIEDTPSIIDVTTPHNKYKTPSRTLLKSAIKNTLKTPIFPIKTENNKYSTIKTPTTSHLKSPCCSPASPGFKTPKGSKNTTPLNQSDAEKKKKSILNLSTNQTPTSVKRLGVSYSSFSKISSTPKVERIYAAPSSLAKRISTSTPTAKSYLRTPASIKKRTSNLLANLSKTPSSLVKLTEKGNFGLFF